MFDMSMVEAIPLPVDTSLFEFPLNWSLVHGEDDSVMLSPPCAVLSVILAVL